MVEGAGRMPLGHGAIRRRRGMGQAREKTTAQAELARDKARIKLLELRRKYKLKVRLNEAKMDARRGERQKSLNPIVHQTMPSRDYAKSLRNPVNWSAVPRKPKYSRVDPKERIYGKRFEIKERKLGQSRTREIPEVYREAAQKMAESVAGLRKDIAERAKEIG